MSADKLIKSKVVAIRLPIGLYEHIERLADQKHTTMHSYIVTMLWNTTHWKKESK